MAKESMKAREVKRAKLVAEIGSVGQCVLGLDQQVFVISRNDHLRLPPENEFCLYYL